MEHVEHFAHSTQMRARYMHNPHQRADDSMIVGNEGVVNPRIFLLLCHLYKDIHIQDASLF